jgi:hypothetical protein
MGKYAEYKGGLKVGCPIEISTCHQCAPSVRAISDKHWPRNRAIIGHGNIRRLLYLSGTDLHGRPAMIVVGNRIHECCATVQVRACHPLEGPPGTTGL